MEGRPVVPILPDHQAGRDAVLTRPGRRPWRSDAPEQHQRATARSSSREIASIKWGRCTMRRPLRGPDEAMKRSESSTASTRPSAPTRAATVKSGETRSQPRSTIRVPNPFAVPEVTRCLPPKRCCVSRRRSESVPSRYGSSTCGENALQVSCGFSPFQDGGIDGLSCSSTAIPAAAMPIGPRAFLYVAGLGIGSADLERRAALPGLPDSFHGHPGQCATGIWSLTLILSTG